MNNSLQKQVGGRHYKDFTIQPVELFAATRWDYFQSSIARYILRYKNKNGIEDLEKAIHIAHLASDLSVEEKRSMENIRYIEMFSKANNISGKQQIILEDLESGKWSDVWYKITELKTEMEEKE